MSNAAESAKTDTASKSKGRVIVSLPEETAEILDNIGLNLSAAVEEKCGIAPEFSRAQVVQAIAKDAQRRQDAAWDESHAEATTDGEQ